jgi:hypothetical protein
MSSGTTYRNTTIPITTTVSTNAFIDYGTFSAKPFIVRFTKEELEITGDGNPEVQTGHSLSTGAKAGIGVGAALGAFVLLALGVFLYLRKARSQRNQTVQSNWLSSEHKAELHNETIQPKELPATQNRSYHEVNPGAPAELGTQIR